MGVPVDRTTLLGAATIVSLLLAGCSSAAAGAPGASAPEMSHTMPDGTEMSGSEHDAHASDASGPSAAAQMICAGQGGTAGTKILGLEDEAVPMPSWDAPDFPCTYDADGMPLQLSVRDATDVAAGEAHFADLQAGLDDAKEIEGLLGLGLPSFSTGDGIVAFLRDGKTLVVDATALPTGLGPDGTRTQDQVAYAVASAVLTCWVDHS